MGHKDFYLYLELRVESCHRKEFIMTFMDWFGFLMSSVALTITLFLWRQITKPQKDDPRISKGLRLLQSKISIIEDLSDKTEAEVQKLRGIIDNKIKEIQSKMILAEQVIRDLNQAVDRSLESAKIFQEEVPHEEWVERQNTLKLVKAAKLAKLGFLSQEISQHIDLPKAQIDFIVKVNKDQLTFEEDKLPLWLQNELKKDPLINQASWRHQKLSENQTNSQAAFTSIARPLSQQPEPGSLNHPGVKTQPETLTNFAAHSTSHLGILDFVPTEDNNPSPDTPFFDRAKTATDTKTETPRSQENSEKLAPSIHNSNKEPMELTASSNKNQMNLSFNKESLFERDTVDLDSFNKMREDFKKTASQMHSSVSLEKNRGLEFIKSQNEDGAQKKDFSFKNHAFDGVQFLQQTGAKIFKKASAFTLSPLHQKLADNSNLLTENKNAETTTQTRPLNEGEAAP